MPIQCSDSLEQYAANNADAFGRSVQTRPTLTLAGGTGTRRTASAAKFSEPICNSGSTVTGSTVTGSGSGSQSRKGWGLLQDTLAKRQRR